MMERQEPMYYYNRPRRGLLLTVALILVIIAIVLLIAGYASPGWLYIHLESASSVWDMHTGLWYAVVCVDDDCASGSIVDNGGRSFSNPKSFNRKRVFRMTKNSFVVLDSVVESKR